MGELHEIWKTYKRSRAAVAGLIVVVLLILVAIFAPWLAPRHYSETDMTRIHATPGPGHVFGTDALGRCILSRVIYGTRVSLSVGIVAQALMVIIGVPIGLLAGYRGGWLDILLMRLVDVLYAFPALLFMILFMTLVKGIFGAEDPGPILSFLSAFDRSIGGLLGVFLSLAMISWLTVSRIVRGDVLSVKGLDFVQAAEALGMSRARVMIKHILPNVMPSIIVAATYGIPSFIMMEAGLSFLGLGVEPPMPSWGSMLSQGVGRIRSFPHLMVYPGLALALTMLAFNFLGDGLRSAMDPYARRRR